MMQATSPVAILVAGHGEAQVLPLPALLVHPHGVYQLVETARHRLELRAYDGSSQQASLLAEFSTAILAAKVTLRPAG